MGAPQITFVENTPWHIREVLALNVRRYRHAAKLSQEELAHRAEIDRTYISEIERCVYAASIDVVDRLARELGVEAADLLRRPPVSKKGPTSAISGREAAGLQSRKTGRVGSQ
jgi:transcriptional regulator with XRE-family HTH domain